MRALSSNVLAHLGARAGQDTALLVWFEARNRTTQAVETIGFWTGADHETFVIDGVTRPYLGAGGLISVPPLIHEVGLSVRTTRLTFSRLDAGVIEAVHGYQINNAPCEIHVAYFDPITGVLIDAPDRRYKGKVKGAKETRPEAGGEGSLVLSLRSSAIDMTIGLPLKKSDAALQARAPGDRLRQYVDIGGAVEVVWGEHRATAPSSKPTVKRDYSNMGLDKG